MPDLDIQFTHSYKKATRLRDAGYEPIECAFGQFGSVMGPLNMDHHGTESHREGVAIRACRDHYGERRNDRRFVVTGAPDADAVVAIIALSGLLPKAKLSADFYELVNAFDIDPIGIGINGSDMRAVGRDYPLIPSDSSVMNTSNNGWGTGYTVTASPLPGVPCRDGPACAVCR